MLTKTASHLKVKMAVQEITRNEIDAALQIFLAKGGVIEKIDQDNSFRFLFHNFLAMENEEFDISNISPMRGVEIDHDFSPMRGVEIDHDFDPAI